MESSQDDFKEIKLQKSECGWSTTEVQHVGHI